MIRSKGKPSGNPGETARKRVKENGNFCVNGPHKPSTPECSLLPRSYLQKASGLDRPLRDIECARFSGDTIVVKASSLSEASREASSQPCGHFCSVNVKENGNLSVNGPHKPSTQVCSLLPRSYLPKSERLTGTQWVAPVEFRTGPKLPESRANHYPNHGARLNQTRKQRWSTLSHF